MGSRYKQQKQTRQGQGERKEGPNHQKLSEMYGELVFTPLETMVKELSGKGITLESGDFGHIKELAGDDFAGRVQDLRQAINDGIPQEHKGAYDGWAKQTINDSFGEEVDAENAFFIILPGQAKKHQLIQALASFVSQHGQPTRMIAETKTAVKALLDQATALVQKLGDDAGAASPEPKREGYPQMGFGEFLAKVREPWRARQAEAKSGLGEIKGQISWLRNWVEGKPRPGRPGADTTEKPKTAIEAKQLEIAALKAKINELQNDESRMAGLKNYTKAGEYATEWATLANTELPKLETELAALEQAEALKQRVETAAGVVAQSPEQATGKFAVGTPQAAAAVTQALADKPAKPSLAEQIANLETQIAEQLAAAEKHEAEALRLRGTVAEAASKDANAAIGVLQNVKAEEEAVKTARNLASKWTLELMELRAEAEAFKPKAKPAATDTQNTDDPITTLEAILEDTDDPELTRATAGLLDAVKVAVAAGKGAKKIVKALARFETEEVDVNAVVADTEALLAIVK